MTSNYTVTTTSPEETRAQAASLIAKFPDRRVYALHGELGSGKTCFVQGVAQALNIRENVASPTYTIANDYSGDQSLYHIDLYRMRDTQDALGIGFEEYLDADGIVAIEWAERATDLIPQDAIHIWFKTLTDPQKREISIEL
jgi:tRNA threonylcarbamoyladenosine biosynthesis protein TsaE